MVTRIRSQERYRPRGSMDPRLSPEIADDRLNEKLGPRMPRPLVRQTNTAPYYPGTERARRAVIGLPDKLLKD